MQYPKLEKRIHTAMDVLSIAIEELREAQRIIESSVPDEYDNPPNVCGEYNRGMSFVNKAIETLKQIQ